MTWETLSEASPVRRWFRCPRPSELRLLSLPSTIESDCADSIPDVIADLPGAEGFAVSPASLNIAGCATFRVSTVTCNGTGFPTNNNPNINIPNGFTNDVKVYNAIGKVDFNVNDKSRVSGMYFFGNNSGTVEDFPEYQSRVAIGHSYAGAGGWREAGHGLPMRAGSMKRAFGYNRLYQPTLPGDLDTPGSSYGLDTGVTGPNTGGLPRIGFGGYFFPGLGGFKWPKFQGPDAIIQFIDHVSCTAGNHCHQVRRRIAPQQRNQRALTECARQHHIPGGV